MAQNTWSTSLTAVLYVILVQFFTPIVLHTNSAIRNYPNGRYSVISWHVMPVVNFGDGNSSTARKPGTRQDKLPCFGCRTSPRGRVLGWCNRHSIASNVKSRTWRSTVGACATREGRSAQGARDSRLCSRTASRLSVPTSHYSQHLLHELWTLF